MTASTTISNAAPAALASTNSSSSSSTVISQVSTSSSSSSSAVIPHQLPASAASGPAIPNGDASIMDASMAMSEDDLTLAEAARRANVTAQSSESTAKKRKVRKAEP